MAAVAAKANWGWARSAAFGLAAAAVVSIAAARAQEADVDLVVRSAAQSSRGIAAQALAPTALRIPMPDRRVWRPIVNAAAQAQGLPADFLDRVLWQESMYFPLAQSPAGAQGIAQFMPGTANERGLADPFDPKIAIPAAAAYLRALERRFGSLGLAAAAYNAGPRVVSRWLTGEVELPRETAAYVRSVTGDDLAPVRRQPFAGLRPQSETPSAARQYSRLKLSPEADLCAKLSTADRPCRVQSAY
jgi:soluble lytic murein transglycosylase-like protein